ncbi:MAG: decaprenyl-phosphate phosphoribosyltransferase [Candidatus Firestonebacteria bacterium]
MLNTLKHIFLSLRPRQWTKNLLILAPLIFSTNLFNGKMLLTALEGFMVFCIISGSVYIMNDLTDLESDKKHPVKKLRPVASGRLSANAARIAGFILVAGGLSWAFSIKNTFGIVVLLYLFLQILYSYRLKSIAILDIIIIAFGFVLRVVAGAKIIDVPMSNWLLVCTMFLSLFLATGKRRYEFMSQGKPDSLRSSLKNYSVKLLDQMITVATSCTVIAYALYTLAPETIKKFDTHRLIYTLPFVLYGIFRYLYLMYKKGKGGSPEDILLSDLPLLFNIFLYAAAVWFIVYK